MQKQIKSSLKDHFTYKQVVIVLPMVDVSSASVFSGFIISPYRHAYKSHAHDHQWADVVNLITSRQQT